jgi:hypothetical protein
VDARHHGAERLPSDVLGADEVGAKLRAFKTDSNPLYLRVDYVGHWGANDNTRETAFRYAFMLHAVGLGWHKAVS